MADIILAVDEKKLIDTGIANHEEQVNIQAQLSHSKYGEIKKDI